MKKYPSSLLENIGRCILICQHIEVILSTMLLHERQDNIRSPESFISEFGKFRTGVLESLKNELRQKGVSYLNFKEIDDLIERKNWLVHRFSISSCVLDVSFGDSGEDLSGLVLYFWEKYKNLEKTCISRIGIPEHELTNEENLNFDLIRAISTEVSKNSEKRLAQRKKNQTG